MLVAVIFNLIIRGGAVNDTEFVWPNFYVVGGQKCGTTSLWAHLKQHAQVYLPAVKEPHFFANTKGTQRDPGQSRFPGDLDTYQALYRPGRQFRAIGDASPSYLCDEDAPRLIHEVCPEAKIIIMLRDPIERAYSHYLMPVMRNDESLPFLEAVRQDYTRQEKGWGKSRAYVELGLYYTPVRRYIEMFGKNHVKVILFDELIKDPHNLLSSVATHLGIDPNGFNQADISTVYNSFREVRFRKLYNLATSLIGTDVRQKYLPPAVQKWLAHSPFLYRSRKPARSAEASMYLQQIYEPDICKLEDLLGRKLPELRKSWVKPA